MGNSEAEENITPHLSPEHTPGKEVDCRKSEHGETSIRSSDTDQAAHHTGDKVRARILLSRNIPLRGCKRNHQGRKKTRSVIFTSSQTPSTEIKVLFYKTMLIRRYVSKSSQCFRCHPWNHTIKVCRSRPRCYHCGKQGTKDATDHYVC